MNFELKTLNLITAAKEKADAMVILIDADFKPGKDPVSLLIAQSLKDGDLESKPGKQLALHRPSQVASTRLILAGIGDGAAKHVRGAVQAAVNAVRGTKAKRLVVLFAGAASAEGVRAAMHSSAEASYVFTTTKSKPEPRTLEKVVVAAADVSKVQDIFDTSTGIVAGVETAKEWANRPANHATPTMLGKAAQEIAKAPRVRCEVLGPREVAKLGMGSFMAVAQGSDEPLRFIVLHYEGAAKTQAPTVLVGKGITFDSGGISIKPAAEMDEMKFDMGGAASVLGTFKALSIIKPAINVVGLIPACENLLNGRAVKPGDVVTSMSGQTIEILNTDAEGRLILCDALTYAERFKPSAVVDIATLTGACVVALGGVRSGMFSANDPLAEELQSAGERAQDLCWRMPLDDEYSDSLKSNFADVANVGGRAGGAITAAKFLQRFTEKFVWGHLDIAGTAWKGGAAKGATGRPVGLLVEFLLARKLAKAPAK